MTEKIYKTFKDEIYFQYGLDAIISQLQKLRTKYTKENKISLDLEIDSGYSNHQTYICGKRLETDEELQKRIEATELDKKKEEIEKEKRRKEYLKLKKEFEK